MANIRIKDITTTATTVANDDYLAMDGSTNGTRKILVDSFVESADLATVATTGAYSDLSGKPSLSTVATSGDYDDLTNKPTIPTVITYSISISANVITLTGSDSSTSTVTLPVYNGGINP